MNVRIFKSEAKGGLGAPPSKSMAHRALICGALSGESRISNLASSKDIEATLSCLKALGAQISGGENAVTIGSLNPFEVSENVTLFCNESGSTLRFFIPLCMLSNKKIYMAAQELIWEYLNDLEIDIMEEA